MSNYPGLELSPTHPVEGAETTGNTSVADELVTKTASDKTVSH